MKSQNVAMGMPSEFQGLVAYNAQTRLQQETVYITGVTRDSTGAALPACVVDLFNTSSDIKSLTTLSDFTTGAYSFVVGPGTGPYYAVAYKYAFPDVAGTTVNTLGMSTTSFDATVLSGCQLWAKADTLALSSGDLITSWTDSSGSGNTLTQTNPLDDYKPIYIANQANGFPVASFTGESAAFCYLNSTAPAAQKPVTFFAVVRFTYIVAIRHVFYHDGGGAASGICVNIVDTANSGVTRYFALQLSTGLGSGTTIATGTGTMIFNTWYVIEITYSATGDYAFYVNGVLDVSGTNNVTPTTANRRISTDSAAFSGYLPELMQFDSVLSASKRSIIRSYLGRKYGIPVYA